MYRIETERSHLFDVNIMIAIEAKVSGKASEDEIKEAFRAAVNSFEILGCKVVISSSGEATYESSEHPQNTLTFRSYRLEELVTEQERIRFRLEDGEILRCFADLSGDGMKFCFAMHHLGGDGKSLCYFIEAFLKRLSGEKCDYRKAVIYKSSELPKQDRLPFFIDLLVKNYNSKWQKERRVFGFDDLEKAYKDFWKDHRTEVKIVRTESDDLSSKLTACKSAGIGFTSYTIAEMTKDVPKVQSVGLAVDGRLDGNRTMSNQATGISVKHRYKTGKSLVDNAKIINGLMKKKLLDDRKKFFLLKFLSSLDPTLTDAMVLEAAGYHHGKTSSKLAELFGYGSKKQDISITNLTRADIPSEYGKFTLEDLIFVPPVISSAQNVVGMVTVNGHLTTAYHRYV